MQPGPFLSFVPDRRRSLDFRILNPIFHRGHSLDHISDGDRQRHANGDSFEILPFLGSASFAPTT
jgi:hypothetical protein